MPYNGKTPIPWEKCCHLNLDGCQVTAFDGLTGYLYKCTSPPGGCQVHFVDSSDRYTHLTNFPNMTLEATTRFYLSQGWIISALSKEDS